MQCNGCGDEVGMVHRHPDGQRFCPDCWRKYMPKEEDKQKYNLCVSCSTVGNIGAWIDEQTFVCDVCAADPNGNCGDCKPVAVANGKAVIPLPAADNRWDDHHLHLKLKGNSKAIAFFHFAISSIDPDWPWRDPKRQHAICPKCGGVAYRNPIVDCDDIKIIAKACGVGKVKIKYWGEACNANTAN